MGKINAPDRGTRKRVYRSRPGSTVYMQSELVREDSEEFAKSVGVDKNSLVVLRYRLHVLNKTFLE